MHALTGTAVHLALDPCPPLRRVAEVTTLLRAAALSRLGTGMAGRDCPLAGRGADGGPMTGGAHAWWLPVTDGRVIAGVCCWAPGGLSPAEREVVASVTWLGGPDRPWLAVTAVQGTDGPPRTLAGPSAEWVTLTPAVLARYPRPRRGRGPAEVVAAELAARGLPDAKVVPEPAGRPWPGRPRGGPLPPQARFRVAFPGPVTGPLAVGRLAHFGLGVLVPA